VCKNLKSMRTSSLGHRKILNNAGRIEKSNGQSPPLGEGLKIVKRGRQCVSFLPSNFQSFFVACCFLLTIALFQILPPPRPAK